MDLMQTAIIGAGALFVLLLVIFAMSGPSEAKAQAKRLDKLKYRHSDSTNVQVEAQMKKAINARKKKRRPTGENMTRLEMFAIRLDRTGHEWPLSYFFYAVGGLAALISAALFINGAPMLLRPVRWIGCRFWNPTFRGRFFD